MSRFFVTRHEVILYLQGVVNAALANFNRRRGLSMPIAERIMLDILPDAKCRQKNEMAAEMKDGHSEAAMVHLRFLGPLQRKSRH